MQNTKCKSCGHDCHCMKSSPPERYFWQPTDTNTYMKPYVDCPYNVNTDTSQCVKTYVYEDRLDGYSSNDYYIDRCDFIKEHQETYKTETIQDGFVPETIYKEATGTIGSKYVNMKVPNTIMVPNYKRVTVSSGLYKPIKKIAVYEYKKCYCLTCKCSFATDPNNYVDVWRYKKPTGARESDTCCVLF